MVESGVVLASGVGSGIDTFAEECGAHADAGAALFDCNGEVVGHADGKLGDSGVMGLLLISQDAKLAKVGTGFFAGVGDVAGPRRNGHQAEGLDVWEFGEGVEQGGKIIG